MIRFRPKKKARPQYEPPGFSNSSDPDFLAKGGIADTTLTPQNSKVSYG